MHRLFLPTAGGRVAVDRIGAVGPVAEIDCGWWLEVVDVGGSEHFVGPFPDEATAERFADLMFPVVSIEAPEPGEDPF